jgi:hypothetical protein
MIENKNLSWIYVGIHKEYNIPIAVSKTIEGLTNLIDHYMGYGVDTSIISKEYKAYNPRYGHNNYQGTHVYTFTDTNKEHISVYISDYYLTGDTLS